MRFVFLGSQRRAPASFSASLAAAALPSARCLMMFDHAFSSTEGLSPSTALIHAGHTPIDEADGEQACDLR